MTHTRCFRHTTLLAPIVLFFLAAAASADSLVVKNITYSDARINAVKDGEIYFTIATSSNEIRKPIADVTRLTLSDEPALSAAEEAYAAKDWDKATEGYDKTLRTTTKPWLKDWSTIRLLDAANKAGRFDTAIKAYIALAEKSPDSARGHTLNMPKPESAYLTDALKSVTSAIQTTKNPATKQVLLSLLAELNKAKGDLKAANEALIKSAEIKAADPNSPEAARAAAMLKLKTITLALSAKEYDKVIAAVEKEGPVFLEPADQAEALFCYAEAKAANAANAKDLDVWKEVALAYMRIVANYPPSIPQVPAALHKTAQIHETHLNEKETALRIYEQIAADYKGQDPAKQAEQQIQRLKAPPAR